MELRHLRYFVTVAEEGHITAAAERLGIQQPPLSRLIKSMERELDAQLFVRKPRGVVLTETGRALFDGARTVLANLDEAVDRTRSTARGERGRLSVGFTTTSAFNPFTAQAIRAFRASYPLVQVTCEEQMSAALVERLRAGQIDAAFLWSPPMDGIVVHPLIEDPLIVALPEGHALARAKRSIAIADLANEDFIIYGRRDGFGLYAATITACHSAHFSPRFGLEAPRLSGALSLVSMGMGVFFVPSSIARIQMDGVSYRRLKGPAPPKAILSLATRRVDHSTVTKHFRAKVRHLARGA